MQLFVVLLLTTVSFVVLVNGKGKSIPRCVCTELTCECCGGFIFKKQSKAVCIRAVGNTDDLTLNLEALLNGVPIGNKQLGPDAVPFCIPGAPLQACFTLRRVSFNLDQAKVCAAIELKFGLKSVYKAQLPCLNLAGGILQVTKN